jgi:hypothetical protein
MPCPYTGISFCIGPPSSLYHRNFTDRGVPIAKLVPFVAGEARKEEILLVAAGKMRLPNRLLDTAALYEKARTRPCPVPRGQEIRVRSARDDKVSYAIDLSSRPERSGVERSAVLPSQLLQSLVPLCVHEATTAQVRKHHEMARWSVSICCDEAPARISLCVELRPRGLAFGSKGKKPVGVSFHA